MCLTPSASVPVAITSKRMRRWLGGGIVLVVACVIAWWRLGGPPVSDGERPARARSRRLDIAAFRATLAARLERARQLAARPLAQPSSSAPPSTPRSPLQGQGLLPNAGKNLADPQCILGPRELCASLEPLIDRCDDGDAPSCIAVGEYLADTPPRPLIANVFFMQACRIGDPDACARYEELRTPSDAPCDRDPFACAWRAYRAHDPDGLEQACALGVADACAFMVERTKADADQSRAYLEAACELGNPMTCAELGHALTPGCIASDQQVCYPPDPSGALAALEMACAAGWGDRDCVTQPHP